MKFKTMYSVVLLGLMSCSGSPSGGTPAASVPAKNEAVSTPAASAPASQPPTSVARSQSPAGARAFIIEPTDGAAVTSPVTVKFGLEGMGVRPAGTVEENTGHHHILIDQENLPAFDQPIPASDKIVHFGKGQTETTLTLEPGTHTLQILLGDANHIPHDPPVHSEKITVTVQ